MSIRGPLQNFQIAVSCDTLQELQHSFNTGLPPGASIFVFQTNSYWTLYAPPQILPPIGPNVIPQFLEGTGTTPSGNVWVQGPVIPFSGSGGDTDDAVIFDDAVAGTHSNTRTNRPVGVQSTIDNTKQGINNYGSNVDELGFGVFGNFGTNIGGDGNTVASDFGTALGGQDNEVLGPAAVGGGSKTLELGDVAIGLGQFATVTANLGSSIGSGLAGQVPLGGTVVPGPGGTTIFVGSPFEGTLKDGDEVHLFNAQGHFFSRIASNLVLTLPNTSFDIDSPLDLTTSIVAWASGSTGLGDAAFGGGQSSGGASPDAPFESGASIALGGGLATGLGSLSLLNGTATGESSTALAGFANADHAVAANQLVNGTAAFGIGSLGEINGDNSIMGGVGCLIGSPSDGSPITPGSPTVTISGDATDRYHVGDHLSVFSAGITPFHVNRFVATQPVFNSVPNNTTFDMNLPLGLDFTFAAPITNTTQAANSIGDGSGNQTLSPNTSFSGSGNLILQESDSASIEGQRNTLFGSAARGQGMSNIGNGAATDVGGSDNTLNANFGIIRGNHNRAGFKPDACTYAGALVTTVTVTGDATDRFRRSGDALAVFNQNGAAHARNMATPATFNPIPNTTTFDLTGPALLPSEVSGFVVDLSLAENATINGRFCVVTGIDGVALGEDLEVPTDNAAARGISAIADVETSDAFAAGTFTQPGGTNLRGDAQGKRIMLRGVAAGAILNEPVPLQTGSGGSTPITVQNSKVYYAQMKIAANGLGLGGAPRDGGTVLCDAMVGVDSAGTVTVTGVNQISQKSSAAPYLNATGNFVAGPPNTLQCSYVFATTSVPAQIAAWLDLAEVFGN